MAVRRVRNENMPVPDRLEVVRKVTSAGLFPTTGVKIIRWDGTPDGWGIVVAEADTAADIGKAINVCQQNSPSGT